jgi:hypothetical protein
MHAAPQHWSDRFIGERYVLGENDCAIVAARAMEAATGRSIVLPTERAGHWRDYHEQIVAARDDLAEKVFNPKDGDAILMIGRARINHIGVFCEIDGTGYALHASEGFKTVVRTRLRDLERFGWKVEGFYRWK